MSFKLRTLHNKIIVKPFPKDEVSAGGVIIPSTAQERKAKATVMAVGDGTKDNPMKLRDGEIVYHVKDCGSEILVDGEAVFIMRDSDVLAIEGGVSYEDRILQYAKDILLSKYNFEKDVLDAVFDGTFNLTLAETTSY